jgi:hypothetical protein
MEEINKTAEQVIGRITQEIKNIKNEQPGSFLGIAEKISELSTARDLWKRTLHLLDSTIDTEKKALQAHLQQMEDQLNQVKKSLNGEPAAKPSIRLLKREEPTVSTPPPESSKRESGWVQVVSRGVTTTPAPAPAAPVRETKPANIPEHEIAPGVTLSAYTITRPEQCHKYPGWWCYCPDTKRFHLSVNNEVLTAVCTVIHSSDKIPIKFHEHHACSEGTARKIDWRSCKFYIPREFNPTSDDVRQFTNRMKFVPASIELGENDKYPIRLGSSDTLREDLTHLKDPDYRLFQDWTGNLMLCFTAAAREMRRRHSS